MPSYVFKCKMHGMFEEVRKFDDAGAPAHCPTCGLAASRVWKAVPDVWHTDGAHKTDYGKGNDGFTGDKKEILNKQWSKYYGEEPPPPAADVPKNSPEKY